MSGRVCLLFSLWLQHCVLRKIRKPTKWSHLQISSQWSIVKAVQVAKTTLECLLGIGHCGWSCGAKQWHIRCAELDHWVNSLCYNGQHSAELHWKPPIVIKMVLPILFLQHRWFSSTYVSSMGSFSNPSQHPLSQPQQNCWLCIILNFGSSHLIGQPVAKRCAVFSLV